MANGEAAASSGGADPSNFQATSLVCASVGRGLVSLDSRGRRDYPSGHNKGYGRISRAAPFKFREHITPLYGEVSLGYTHLFNPISTPLNEDAVKCLALCHHSNTSALMTTGLWSLSW